MADRYYVERIKYLKDGTFKKSEQMDYATEKAAEKKFYKNVSDDMDDDTLNGSLNVVLNSIGAQIEHKFWKNGAVKITPWYFVARVRELKDGTFKKSELMDYEEKRDAVSKCYANMSTDIVDDTLQGSMCTVLDIEGNEVKRDCWDINQFVPPTPPEDEPTE